MGALTKAEIAERLYEELGLNKREAKELVEAVLRRDPPGAGAQRAGQVVRFRQLRPARQAPAPRTQPEDRRRNPDHGPPRCHLSSRAETEGQG